MVKNGQKWPFWTIFLSIFEVNWKMKKLIRCCCRSPSDVKFQNYLTFVNSRFKYHSRGNSNTINAANWNGESMRTAAAVTLLPPFKRRSSPFSRSSVSPIQGGDFSQWEEKEGLLLTYRKVRVIFLSCILVNINPLSPLLIHPLSPFHFTNFSNWLIFTVDTLTLSLT